MREEGRDKDVVCKGSNRSWQNEAGRSSPSEIRETPRWFQGTGWGVKRTHDGHRAYRAMTWGDSERLMTTYFCVDEYFL